MITPKKSADIESRLQLLEEMQRQLDALRDALKNPDRPNPYTARPGDHEEYARTMAELCGQRDGLNAAWIILQRAASALIVGTRPELQHSKPSERCPGF